MQEREDHGGQAAFAPSRPAPVRGPLALTPSLSSPQVTAGTDFSIFVTIQNPFDVPVTLYDVRTHLPVELLDVNRARLNSVLRAGEDGQRKDWWGIGEWLRSRRALIRSQSGVATAVGTGFSPETVAELIKTQVNITGDITAGTTIAGMVLNFPENPSSEELDSVFRRVLDLREGLVPVRLQPGDQIIRQFRLRTRHWLFFAPLTHTFQIQANFSVDGADHNCTVAYPVTIRAQLSAIILGGITGAIVGGLLRVLTQPATNPGPGNAAKAILIAVLATLAVVVGFARKSSSQSFVSVEDFWGGGLIGVSVGFIGYEQFLDLFGAP
jgi:hypothetical protein